MSAPAFIDTGYILALVKTADRHHERARATAVTAEAVLVEIGNTYQRSVGDTWASPRCTTCARP